MKKVIIVMLFFVVTGNTYAKKLKDSNPIIGSWKYTNHSVKNDFQQVLETKLFQEYAEEYFVFEPGNKFRHLFYDNTGKVIKTLYGKWKSIDGKIKIQYTDIEYEVTVNYFFLDTDLVLGKNFNHVIFTRDMKDDKNIALNK